MIDLSTSYLGLDLKCPLVVGSCGLTNSVKKIREIAEAGAGAVVLKSLFEEQIVAELGHNLESYEAGYPDAVDYIREYTRDATVEKYLDLVSAAKKAVDIPVIASLNCVSANEWTSFATQIEKAGADAIELNISLLPSDPRMSGAEAEKKYTEIIDKVASTVSVPLSLKMSQFSSGLAHLLTHLGWKQNINGFVLFNRYYRPDIDIDKMTITSADIFSNPSEMHESLRWVALLSDRIEKDFVASTGIYDGAALIKQLLAGATAAQIVSALYKNGIPYIGVLLEELKQWMEEKSFSRVDDFRGKLSYSNIENPAVFERTQFMKYYGGVS
ncbi:dihydroorotate dehydrogenase-like protein [Desulfotalea psychrophila]|nr:dihydroorotate dehydrogenase-like protein [Desulfotalea psychrophila]